MKRAEPIAIMERDSAPVDADGMQVVRQDGLALVLAPPPRPKLRRRADVARLAAGRMSLLERLLPHGAVLPVVPGQLLTTEEARAALAANAATLRRAMLDTGSLWQFQVTLEVRASDRQGDPLRDEAVRRLIAGLEDVSEDIRLLPVNAELAANAIVLLGAGETGRLDAVLSDVDALGPKRLRLRLVGPAPPVSFASIALRRVAAGEVAAARRVLDMTEARGAAEIRSARAARLRAGEGGRPETVRGAAEILLAAAAGPADSPLFLAHVWSEGMAAAQGPAIGEVV